ncbi:hypothetical protein C8034_v002332 [Colletotrichum sidae]|uniref:Uncharacterized protein n=1 Tax=Colletotrichum sidae TaxID=1347389 RepID=A0A4R8TCY3_9PEZI|nr:hypothetical protein C8034_v002332 [Colletotrichum sidae]
MFLEEIRHGLIATAQTQRPRRRETGRPIFESVQMNTNLQMDAARPANKNKAQGPRPSLSARSPYGSPRIVRLPEVPVPTSSQRQAQTLPWMMRVGGGDETHLEITAQKSNSLDDDEDDEGRIARGVCPFNGPLRVYTMYPYRALSYKYTCSADRDAVDGSALRVGFSTNNITTLDGNPNLVKAGMGLQLEIDSG